MLYCGSISAGLSVSEIIYDSALFTITNKPINKKETEIKVPAMALVRR